MKLRITIIILILLCVLPSICYANDSLEIKNNYNFLMEQYNSLNIDEIEKSILKMMIKAIFNKFYDFEEEQYIKDYTELKCLINSDDIYTTYQNGYSLLKSKIDNSIENYCTLKK